MMTPSIHDEIDDTLRKWAVANFRGWLTEADRLKVLYLTLLATLKARTYTPPPQTLGNYTLVATDGRNHTYRILREGEVFQSPPPVLPDFYALVSQEYKDLDPHEPDPETEKLDLDTVY